ncbi:hypothetical protein DSOUD_2095 [Desulfuromonas soudanensis]|uniref:Polysaccharide deacetylase n=1 Tax=Desulfuromonas soudanensis TaxID=1603606 RepID=A0A0M4DI76_9BACT|nr:polysaccharide deacetylase family protein [Desulfuromonas soudanensis]ALC16862.1 hypothetical protein DSOUD_2095 [Desulfuromonas soudanensis]
MKLIITIDTEEDNWARYSATDNSVENIARIVPLQKMFDEYGVRPTYLVTYPVATNPRSVAILKRILEEGKCEIGTHCHPWNTPPFDDNGGFQKAHSMLCNLPAEFQQNKLAMLHEVITKNFGCLPVSFRAGRWALGLSAAQSLCKLGYRVETSVTPFVSWSPSFGPDFSNFGPEPFRFSPPGEPKWSLLQVPTSIGYLQKNFQLCQRLSRALDNPFSRISRVKGILDRLGLVNKVWLSPELADADAMIALAKRMEINNFPCINMTFHSASLLAGLSPFVRISQDEQVFFGRIKKLLEAARQAGWKSMPLAQFEAVYEGVSEPGGVALLDGQGQMARQRQTEQMRALFRNQGARL